MAVVDEKSIQNLLNMSSGAGEDLLNNLILLFRSETPKRIEEIRRGIQGNDLKLIEMASHSLKSGSAYLGVLAIVDIAKEIELSSREGVLLNGIEEKLVEIECAFGEALEYFELRSKAS